MKKSFLEIHREEQIKIPITRLVASRVQRFNSNKSVDFFLDNKSIELLKAELPFKCTQPFLKKMAENIIILNRLKHRKTDISRLELMNSPKYRFNDDSFYYSVE